mgnify:CR=1 FL=1
MFNNLLKKEKPRVFLGTLSVVPRTDFKKIDEWGVFHKEDIDSEFRQTLEEIFSLPLAAEVEKPLKTDLVLDVIISQFQSGDAWGIDVGIIEFPIFWRPKVEVKSRLYSLKSKKTKKVFSATEKIKWSKFFNRILSWRGLLRFRPVFDKSDMNYLLYKACHRLLLEMKKSL